MSSRLWLVILALASLIPAVALAEDQPKAADSRPKRVLLLGQKLLDGPEIQVGIDFKKSE